MSPRYRLSDLLRPLRIILLDQKTREVLLESRFQLCKFCPQIYIHFDSPKSEGETLGVAQQELKARERGLTIQGVMVVQAQRPYLWGDPFIIQIPAPNPRDDALKLSWALPCSAQVQVN